VTSATGDYSVSHLVNGTYTIEAEYPGLRAAVISHVVVRAAQTVRADIPMKLGEVKQWRTSAGPGKRSFRNLAAWSAGLASCE